MTSHYMDGPTRALVARAIRREDPLSPAAAMLEYGVPLEDCLRHIAREPELETNNPQLTAAKMMCSLADEIEAQNGADAYWHAVAAAEDRRLRHEELFGQFFCRSTTR